MDVIGTDIADGHDFLKYDSAPDRCDAIITNPEFRLAAPIIEHAIELMRRRDGMVAMLLRTDFGHAKTRQHLFGACPQFSKKIELTKRIVFFDRPGAAPSFSHAWFVWDWEHVGEPTIIHAGDPQVTNPTGSKLLMAHPRRRLPIRTAARASPRTAARRRIGAQR
jgi:hypothetical protein